MRSFNVSTQSKNILRQAFLKEYIYPLEGQIDSLYKYLHYYNPEWRIVGINADGRNLAYWTEDTLITESSIVDASSNIDLTKLHFRWGIKNTSAGTYHYGGGAYTLNIGATLYKKDAYDISSNTADAADHFLVFESALAQYYTWTNQTVQDGPNTKLQYLCRLSNELDFGLSYTLQFMISVPRYFYKDGNNNTEYTIRHQDSSFDTNTLFDYNNYNLRYSINGSSFTPSSFSSNVYQKWSGASEIVADVLIKNDSNQYEDFIGDVCYYQSPGRVSEFQVRLESNTATSSEPGRQALEGKIKVVFS